jgi:hypothetical protein
MYLSSALEELWRPMHSVLTSSGGHGSFAAERGVRIRTRNTPSPEVCPFSLSPSFFMHLLHTVLALLIGYFPNNHHTLKRSAGSPPLRL